MKRRVNLSKGNALRKAKTRRVTLSPEKNGKIEARRKKDQVAEQSNTPAKTTRISKLLRVIGRGSKWLLLTFLTAWSGR